MREIKFRAWNETSKQLITEQLELRKMTLWLSTGLETLDGWALMQFTGLKDKNNKEIFEGDIVKYEVWETFHQDVSEVTRVVDWNDKMCGWNPMCQHVEVDDGYYNWEIENVEIIGNIYENPELLTSKEPRG